MTYRASLPRVSMTVRGFSGSHDTALPLAESDFEALKELFDIAAIKEIEMDLIQLDSPSPTSEPDWWFDLTA